MARRKCCCSTPPVPWCVCNIESSGTSFQGTGSGIADVHSPPDPDADPPCECTTLNTTMPMLPEASGSDAHNLFADGKTDGKWCLYSSGSVEFCLDAGGRLAARYRAWLYQNDTGGVSARGEITVEQGTFIIPTKFSTDEWEGTAVVDSDNDEIDCSTIDANISLPNHSHTGDDLWCGGTPSLRFEAV